MNFSAIFINIAQRAVLRAYEAHYHASLAVYEAIVFASLALEALLNEQAFIEINNLGRRSKLVYDAVERGAQGFERVQAILTYLYERGLQDGENPANDLKHLIRLRNGLVHYRFEEPPAKTLDDLAQRGLVDAEWRQEGTIAWPSGLGREVAGWAYHTACQTAHAIAGLLPNDPPHRSEAALIRNDFDLDGLDELQQTPKPVG